MIKTGPPKPLAGLKKQPAEVLDSANLTYVAGLMRAEDRRFALRFLLQLFAVCVALTFLVILVQGWQVWGFDLPEDFLRWLGIAVIAEVSAILGAVITSLFKCRA